MDKSLLLAVLFLSAGSAFAAGEKYLAATYYQGQNCTGEAVFSAFGVTEECHFFNNSYTMWRCEKTGYRTFTCADPDCTSCSEKTTPYECDYVLKLFCTNTDITKLYGKDAPIEFAYGRDKCTEDPLTTTIYNAPSTIVDWAECIDGDFYQHQCFFDEGCNNTVQMSMDCTWNPKTARFIKRACGWGSLAATSEATKLLSILFVISFIVLTF